MSEVALHRSEVSQASPACRSEESGVTMNEYEALVE
jgi:hypothetical protein